MKRIFNPYKESSIFELNMMSVSDFRSVRLNMAEIAVLALPFVLVVFIICANFLPSLTFMADCRNITEGDICMIRLA